MLANRPAPSDLQAAVAAGQGSPEMASNQIRRLFLQQLEQAKLAAKRIHKGVTTHGRRSLVAALGDDGDDLDAAYAALKTMIVALDPAATVPDLPA